ncbi:MAG TPA: VOC family protein [Chryseosolibacter sp.]|nr:VOC family protein [Chryseosolibacter sp.]
MDSEKKATTPSTRVPDGAPVVIPRLVCRDPAAAIDFYTKTFGAVERLRRAGPDGKVAHAMILIRGQMVMIEAEWPALPSRAPGLDGSSPVVMYLYVENVDETFESAIKAGAQMLIPLTDQFWGDRTAWIMDPAGHVWTIASRIEETTEEERKNRWSDILKQDH